MKATLTRDAVVSKLMNHVLESIHQDASGEVLRGILRHGFPGFERMTDSQLDSELQLRGLAEGPLLSAREDDDDSDSSAFSELGQEIAGLAPLPFSGNADPA